MTPGKNTEDYAEGRRHGTFVFTHEGQQKADECLEYIEGMGKDAEPFSLYLAGFKRSVAECIANSLA